MVKKDEAYCVRFSYHILKIFLIYIYLVVVLVQSAPSGCSPPKQHVIRSKVEVPPTLDTTFY